MKSQHPEIQAVQKAFQIAGQNEYPALEAATLPMLTNLFPKGWIQTITTPLSTDDVEGIRERLQRLANGEHLGQEDFVFFISVVLDRRLYSDGSAPAGVIAKSPHELRHIAEQSTHAKNLVPIHPYATMGPIKGETFLPNTTLLGGFDQLSHDFTQSLPSFLDVSLLWRQFQLQAIPAIQVTFDERSSAYLVDLLGATGRSASINFVKEYVSHEEGHFADDYLQKIGVSWSAHPILNVLEEFRADLLISEDDAASIFATRAILRIGLDLGRPDINDIDVGTSLLWVSLLRNAGLLERASTGRYILNVDSFDLQPHLAEKLYAVKDAMDLLLSTDTQKQESSVDALLRLSLIDGEDLKYFYDLRGRVKDFIFEGLK